MFHRKKNESRTYRHFWRHTRGLTRKRRMIIFQSVLLQNICDIFFTWTQHLSFYHFFWGLLKFSWFVFCNYTLKTVEVLSLIFIKSTEIVPWHFFHFQLRENKIINDWNEWKFNFHTNKTKILYYTTNIFSMGVRRIFSRGGRAWQKFKISKGPPLVVFSGLP